MQNDRKAGFTLVELLVVISYYSIAYGGVAAGVDLRRACEPKRLFAHPI